jgi:hypothetical protein
VNSWFDLTVSQASVGQWSYFVNSSYDTSYGITIVENPVPRQQVIWDSLVITITDPTDQRVDVGTNATGILVSAVYAFDGMVFDGNLILNNSNFQYATPQIQGYTVVVAAGDTYGITAIGTNDVTYCIWDRVRVVSIYADELYHDPNDDAVISVELEYEYDGSPVLAGTFAIVGNPLTHAGSGLWETTVTSGSYQTVDFNDLSSCDATLHGVSVYNMNSNLVTVYWDRLEFYAVSVADDRISIGAGAEILWSVRLESAGISISTGISAQMTGSISLSPLGGFVTGTVSQNSIGSMTYAVTSATLGEINEFSQSTGDITIIWDRIKVVSVTASLLSVNVNQPTEIRATLVYEFDNSPVTDGTVYLDNNGAPVAMVYDATNGYWTASISQTSAEDYSFTIHSVEGNTFGITSLNLDGKSVMIEWVNVAGPAPDTMTLILLGGGVGIVAIGAAVVASKKRKSRKPDGLGEIDATAFGIEEEVTAEATDDIPAVETEEDVVEAEISEPSEEEIAEEDVEPIVPEEDIEEPEDVSVEETEEAIPVTEEDDVPEPEVIPEEAAGGMVTRVELDRDKIWSKDDRDEMVFKFHPEHLPEEVKTKTSQVKAKTDGTYSWDDAVALGNLLALTKDELIELLPEDYIATTTPEKLKRLTKKEIISLIELLRVRDTL